jgi:hypothetical protein
MHQLFSCERNWWWSFSICLGAEYGGSDTFNDIFSYNTYSVTLRNNVISKVQSFLYNGSVSNVFVAGFKNSGHVYVGVMFLGLPA